MKNRLNARDMAPQIRTNDIWGNAVEVPSKSRWTYLSFHRFADCPFCNLRTNELIRNYDQFKAQNIEIASIWPSEREKLLQFENNHTVPFHIISDEEKNIYSAYGVTESSVLGGVRLLFHPLTIVNALKNKRKNIEVDADPKLMPASFLINPKGIIEKTFYGKHFGDHPTIESIFEFKNRIK